MTLLKTNTKPWRTVSWCQWGTSLAGSRLLLLSRKGLILGTNFLAREYNQLSSSLYWLQVTYNAKWRQLTHTDTHRYTSTEYHTQLPILSMGDIGFHWWSAEITHDGFHCLLLFFNSTQCSCTHLETGCPHINYPFFEHHICPEYNMLVLPVIERIHHFPCWNSNWS